MRNPDFDYMMMQQQHREDLAAAAQSRLIKAALEAERADRPAPMPSLLSRIAQGLVLGFGRALYWFGERIQVWGCRLQYRFAVAEMRSEPAPCK